MNELNLDIDIVDSAGNNGLSYACQQNDNIEIKKYLIKDLQMDIYHINKFGFNCIDQEYYSSKRQICKFFLEIIRVNVLDLNLFKLFKIKDSYLIYKNCVFSKELNENNKIRITLFICDII